MTPVHRTVQEGLSMVSFIYIYSNDSFLLLLKQTSVSIPKYACVSVCACSHP